MRIVRNATFGTVFLAGILVVGCGGGTRNPVVPVEGKVTFIDGKPLPNGTKVVFNPSEGGSGTATGVTDANGSFKLTHSNGTIGAEVGKYTVVLRAPDGDTGTFYKSIPSDYYDAGAFAVEVKQGMPSVELTIKKGR